MYLRFSTQPAAILAVQLGLRLLVQLLNIPPRGKAPGRLFRLEESTCFSKISSPSPGSWWVWATRGTNTNTPATTRASWWRTSWANGGASIQRLKFKALTSTAAIGGQGVLVMKPVTYMNLSGEAVGEAARFYKIPPERVLVISDDVDLPLGRLRLRTSGSAGGHNGLKSVIQHLGGSQFPRLKVGVGGKPHPDYDMADWVLGRLQGEDKKVMDQAVKRAADAVECFLRDGPQKAMNQFN